MKSDLAIEVSLKQVDRWFYGIWIGRLFIGIVWTNRTKGIDP